MQKYLRVSVFMFTSLGIIMAHAMEQNEEQRPAKRARTLLETTVNALCFTQQGQQSLVALFKNLSIPDETLSSIITGNSEGLVDKNAGISHNFMAQHKDLLCAFIKNVDTPYQNSKNVPYLYSKLLLIKKLPHDIIEQHLADLIFDDQYPSALRATLIAKVSRAYSDTHRHAFQELLLHTNSSEIVAALLQEKVLSEDFIQTHKKTIISHFSQQSPHWVNCVLVENMKDLQKTDKILFVSKSGPITPAIATLAAKLHMSRVFFEAEDTLSALNKELLHNAFMKKLREDLKNYPVSIDLQKATPEEIDYIQTHGDDSHVDPETGRNTISTRNDARVYAALFYKKAVDVEKTFIAIFTTDENDIPQTRFLFIEIPATRYTKMAWHQNEKKLILQSIDANGLLHYHTIQILHNIIFGTPSFQKVLLNSYALKYSTQHLCSFFTARNIVKQFYLNPVSDGYLQALLSPLWPTKLAFHKQRIEQHFNTSLANLEEELHACKSTTFKNLSKDLLLRACKTIKEQKIIDKQHTKTV